MIFSVDGINWDYGCTVTRTAEMTPSEISGLMLDKSYFNDVLGTYMKYSVRIEVPFGREEEYNSLYEAITNPTGAHEFVLPYAGRTIRLVGRVQNISDIYVRMKKGKVHWRGIQFDVIGNHPTKKMTLDGAISTMGVPALPSETTVNVGAIYIYSSNGWQEMPSAEDNYY